MMNKIMGKEANFMNQSMTNDEQRLLGVREARKFLNNMPRTTFYRNIKRGIIPKQRYLGGTPVWRLADLQSLYDHLPEEPLSAETLSSSR